MKTFFIAILFLIAGGVAQAQAVTLKWTDNSGGSLGFIVERARGCEAPTTNTCNKPASPFTELTRVNAGVVTFDDNGAQLGDCYRVKGFNATSVSLPTNNACVIPGPNGLQLSFADDLPVSFAGTLKSNKITATSADGYQLVATIGKRNQVSATVTR